jgi:hypothetical protein
MKEYQEKNKDSLSEAIAGLPRHSPPADLWVGIETRLEQQHNLQTALAGLPRHQPPVSVWEQVERELDSSRGRKQPRSYRILRKARPWVAAATLCGLAFGAWWFLEAETPARTSIAYSEEVQMRVSFTADWNDEQDQIAFVMEQVDQSPVADPREVKRLKSEYEELIDARNEVEDMLKRYGNDENLLKEVARIERERSQVIKELATWI